MPGAKINAIGDSITQADDLENGINGNTSSLYQNSWLDYACMLSGGVLRRGINAGISGQTSVQIAARFATDALSNSPSAVIILCGTNDIGQSVAGGGSTPNATAFANFQASIQSMVNTARSRYIQPILSTVPPNNAAGRHALIVQFNLWLKLYASRNRLTILDFYGQATDPTNGNYLASWATGDGTHPGIAGYVLYGTYVSNKLTPIVGVNAPFVSQSDDDATGLLTHPLFLGGALNAQGVPPGWSINSGFPTGLTASYVTDSAVGGNMYQLAAATSSGPYQVIFPFTAGSWSAGDTIAFSGILTSNGGVQPGIAFLDQAGTLNQVKPTNAITRGYFYVEQIIPSRSTTVYVGINIPQGTGTFSLGQLGVYNLTKLGLTS